jgi:hypothetical protein
MMHLVESEKVKPRNKQVVYRAPAASTGGAFRPHHWSLCKNARKLVKVSKALCERRKLIRAFLIRQVDKKGAAMVARGPGHRTLAACRRYTRWTTVSA